MYPFHSKCGEKLTLINDNFTATRNFIENNKGLLFSECPLRDDSAFVTRIDSRIKAWEGSFEIGLTTLLPEEVDLEQPASSINGQIWIMMGTSVLKNGEIIIEDYGPDLDSLQEGDQIGVMRSSKGELIFLLNGERLGVAAVDVPQGVHAIVALNGRCVQVSISRLSNLTEECIEQLEDDPNNDLTINSDLDVEFTPTPGSKECEDVRIAMPVDNTVAMRGLRDKLCFHPRCGLLVHISSNYRTAVRQRPLDDYNNGVVITNRPLHDDELFSVRIDRLVDKWSGSIELGVTSHNPCTLRFPSTMTNMESGTVMMSGGKVLVNGHSTFADNGNLNLDELRAGDIVGMTRRSSGYLHFFVNGVDKGAATEVTAPQVWGVVDLYGMAVQVTIVDDEDEFNASANSIISRESVPDENESFSSRHNINEESLLFHSLHNTHVVVINDGKTAHRFNALEYFNHGLVMTSRPLRSGELFQVRLDLLIQKWVGSLQIGVTTQGYNEAATITMNNHVMFLNKNSESGTWVICGSDLLRNGPHLTRSLSQLEEGDTAAVLRNPSGSVNLYINGVFQGTTKFTVPEHIYGIVDLYGPVAQVTIVDEVYPATSLLTPSPGTPASTDSNPTIYPDLCFNRVHGSNVRIGRLRTTAYRLSMRPHSMSCLLLSSRPLRECEMFEIRIDKTVGFGNGHFEFGTTSLCPDELELSNMSIENLTDTYTLRGNSVISGGKIVSRDYGLDTTTLTIGSKVGLMWHADRSLHFYLDGIDQGKAVHLPGFNIYAIIILYGRVMQVSVTTGDENGFNCNGCISENSLLNPKNFISLPPDPFSFSEYRGDNIYMSSDYTLAKRKSKDLDGALVFSAGYITSEPFEIKLESCDSPYAGNLRVGLTDTNILNALVNRCLPPSITCMPHYTTYIDGPYLKCSKHPDASQTQLRSISHSFEELFAGDKIIMRRCEDSSVCLSVNDVEVKPHFENVPEKVYAVFELYGQATAIRALSSKADDATTNSELPLKETLIDDQINSEHLIDQDGFQMHQDEEIIDPPMKIFTEIHGKNIRLTENDTVATRCCGYADGIVILAQPLSRGQSYKFRINKVTDAYANGFCVGAVAQLPDYMPRNATLLQAPCWIVCTEMVVLEDSALVSSLGASLDKVKSGSVITLHWRNNSKLTVKVDGEPPILLATVPEKYSELYGVVDLYGNCEELSVLQLPNSMSGSCSDEPLEEFQKIMDTRVVVPVINSQENENIPSSSLTKTIFDKTNITTDDLEEEAMDKNPFKEIVNETIKRSQSLNAISIKAYSQYLEMQKSSKTFHDLSEISNPELQAAMECIKDLTLNDFNMYGQNEGSPPSKEFKQAIEEVNSLLPLHDEEKMHGPEEEQASSIDSEEVVAALVGRAIKWPNLNSSFDTLVRDLQTNLLEIDMSDSGESSIPPSNEYSYLRALFSEHFNISQSSAYPITTSECNYLQSALKYWQELVPGGRQNILRGPVECFCDQCAPACQDALRGWVRLNSAVTKSEAETPRSYFTVADHSLVINALMTALEAKQPISQPDPDAFGPTPLCIDYCFALATDGLGRTESLTIRLRHVGAPSTAIFEKPAIVAIISDKFKFFT